MNSQNESSPRKGRRATPTYQGGPPTGVSLLNYKPMNAAPPALKAAFPSLSSRSTTTSSPKSPLQEEDDEEKEEKKMNPTINLSEEAEDSMNANEQMRDGLKQEEEKKKDSIESNPPKKLSDDEKTTSSEGGATTTEEFNNNNTSTPTTSPPSSSPSTPIRPGSMDNTSTSPSIMMRIRAGSLSRKSSDRKSKRLSTSTSSKNEDMLLRAVRHFLSKYCSNLKKKIIKWGKKRRLTMGPNDDESGPVEISLSAQMALDQLKGLKSTAFDTENPAHEHMLKKIWTLLRPNVDYERIHKQWNEVGFQGKDPVTDLRGQGVLGLKNIVAFVSSNIKFCHEIVKKNDLGFPLSLAIINISAHLFETLSTTPSFANFVFNTTENTEDNVLDLFNELFSIVFIDFERFYAESIATYLKEGGIPALIVMEFNRIRKEFFEGLMSQILAGSFRDQYSSLSANTRTNSSSSLNSSLLNTSTSSSNNNNNNNNNNNVNLNSSLNNNNQSNDDIFSNNSSNKNTNNNIEININNLVDESISTTSNTLFNTLSDYVNNAFEEEESFLNNSNRLETCSNMTPLNAISEDEENIIMASNTSMIGNTEYLL